MMSILLGPSARLQRDRVAARWRRRIPAPELFLRGVVGWSCIALYILPVCRGGADTVGRADQIARQPANAAELGKDAGKKTTYRAGLTVELEPGQIQGLGSSVASWSAGNVSSVGVGAIQHAFTLRNDGDGVVDIDRFVPACDCTGAAIRSGGIVGPPLTLGPGTSAVVDVSVDRTALSPGPFAKQVWVYGRGQAQPLITLEVAGILLPAISVTPTILDFGLVRRKRSEARLFTIAIDSSLVGSGTFPTVVCSNADVQITTLSSTDHLRSASISEGAGAGQAAGMIIQRTYVATIVPGARTGVIGGRIALMLPPGNDRLCRLVNSTWVAMTGRVVGHVTANPPELLFGRRVVGDQAWLDVSVIGPSHDQAANLTSCVASTGFLARSDQKKTGVAHIAVDPNATVGLHEGAAQLRTATGEVVVVPLSVEVVPR